jgi:hypothetical protein
MSRDSHSHRSLNDTRALEPGFAPAPYASPINEETQTLIIDLYTEGKSLAAIAREPGMPAASAIYKLHRDNEFFRERLSAARITRALQLEEEILALGDKAESLDKDAAPGARLAFDIKRFGAEVNDPATYGKKTTVQGDGQRPIVFQFVSHIPEALPKEEVPIEVEGKTLDEG